MIHSVKILRPDRDGKLIEVEQISGLEASKIHWSNFGADTNRAPNKNRPKEAQRLGVKYHRIGVDLKQCIEKNCKVIITDPRRKTCSPECKNKRVERQRQLSKEKKRAKYQEIKKKERKKNMSKFMQIFQILRESFIKIKLKLYLNRQRKALKEWDKEHPNEYALWIAEGRPDAVVYKTKR